MDFPSLSLHTAIPNNQQDPQEYTARPGEQSSRKPWENDLPPSTSVINDNGDDQAPNTLSTLEDMNNASDDMDDGGYDLGYDPDGPVPGLENGLSRPLTTEEHERLAYLDRLKFFLATAPSRWDTGSSNPSSSSSSLAQHSSTTNPSNLNINSSNGSTSAMQIPPAPPPHPALNRFLLPSQEFVTCVLWNGLYHITGTDIVRALVFRFEAFGRPVRNMKKFEEGVFSDLRNLKPGIDACLEEPKSPFLDLLFKYQCIRTQKKQKVFYWFSVPHDRLFLDALDRDLKREKQGGEPTTQVVGEPALSFTYDPKRGLYEQFMEPLRKRASAARRGHPGASGSGLGGSGSDDEADEEDEGGQLHKGGEDEFGFASASDASDVERSLSRASSHSRPRPARQLTADRTSASGNPFLMNMFSLSQGSAGYKQRRKKGGATAAAAAAARAAQVERGRTIVPMGGLRFQSDGDSSLSREQGYDASYEDGEMSGGDAENVQVKSEPLSAADMFLKQARGELAAPNPSGANAQRKRHSMIDPREVGVYVEGRLVGMGVGASASLAGTGGSGGAVDSLALGGLGVGAYSTGIPGIPARGRSADATGVRHAYSPSPTQGQGSMSASFLQSSFGSRTQSPMPPGSAPTSFEGYPSQFGASYPDPQQPQQWNNYAGMPTGIPPGMSHGISVGQVMGGVPMQFGFNSPLAASSSTGGVKSYPCPLLSCGRTFKRMEHLKRHLRTHTMERPFVCTHVTADGTTCGKRFSRSDNLGQHMRVHGKEAKDGANKSQSNPRDGEWTQSSTVNEWIDMNNVVSGSAAAGSSTSGHSPNGATSDGEGSVGSAPHPLPGSAPASDIGEEMIDELELDMDYQARRSSNGIDMALGMFGDQGLGMGMGMGVTAMSMSTKNMTSRQTPTGDAMMDVDNGPAEGQDMYYQSANQWNAAANNMGQEFYNRPNGSTTSLSSASSFGGHDDPSPNSAGAQYLGVPQYNHVGMPMSVSSAPSQKQHFDHSSLYPGVMMEGGMAHPHPTSSNTLPPGVGAGIGGMNSTLFPGGSAVRRHRSMTPSLMRNPEINGRRPGSSHSVHGHNVGGDYFTAGEMSQNRGYHPYASNSRTSSAHSSPSGGMSLGLPVQMMRSESRASNASYEGGGSVNSMNSVHENMAHRLSLNGDRPPDIDGGYAGEIYRTESPAPFAGNSAIAQGMTESPAAFVTDLPPVNGYSGHQQQPHYHATYPNPNQTPQHLTPHVHHAATVPATHYHRDNMFVVGTSYDGRYNM